MSQELVSALQKQNRLLKSTLALGAAAFAVSISLAAMQDKTRMRELDVERINIVGADGKAQLVIANRARLPGVVIDGQASSDHRQMPGLIFYNEAGDECGGLIWKGKLDAQGKPEAGMHFSMDRFGGDQQLALGHYEDSGFMSSGLNVYDRGVHKEYAPLWDAMEKAPAGPERDKLAQKWEEAGGRQTPRVFVGKTRGKSSAVILSDAQGRARIMMLVTPEGEALLQFLDERGEVTQSYPQNTK
jgi:hypothetical protein